MTTPLHVQITNDDFECTCGNNSHAQGAYPSDINGELVPDDWPLNLWCCDRCGAIFKIPENEPSRFTYTGPAEIVGQRKKLGG